MDESKSADSIMGCSKDRCSCSNYPIKRLSKLRMSANKTTPICACTSSYTLSEEETRHRRKLYQRKHLYVCRKSKDFCDPHKDDFFKLFPGYKFRCSKKFVVGIKSGAKIAILTCPKVGGFKFTDKSAGSSRSKNSFGSSKPTLNIKSSKNMHTTGTSTIDKGIQNSGNSLFGRVVCDTVKELIKDIIVSDITHQQINTLPSDFEYVTVESLLKEISSLTRSKNNSNITINENEIHSDVLSGPEVITLEKKESRIISHALTKQPKDEDIYMSYMNYHFFWNVHGDSPLTSSENSMVSCLSLIKSSDLNGEANNVHSFYTIRQRLYGLGGVLWNNL